jgi:hypothetical protein
MVWKDRMLEQTISHSMKNSECIVITGARQSGKTSLIRNICKKKWGKAFTEFSFDTPTEIDRFQRDPDLFFASQPGILFLDEIQNIPEIFPYIKREIDKNRKKFRFFLSGSQQFQLMKKVSESLAGRATILDLYPFSELEKSRSRKDFLFSILTDPRTQNRTIGKKFPIQASEIMNMFLRGGFPEVTFKKKINPLWFESYRRTYIQRDIRDFSQISNLGKFDRFLVLCASRTGNLFNKSDFANSLDVDNKTIDHWISLLESSYLIHLSRPYYTNISKRLIRSPKLHFVDMGLCLHLLMIQNKRTLENSIQLGHFFESFVISEVKKYFASSGFQIPLPFYRTSTGKECDLILELGGQTLPIEIKYKMKISNKDILGIQSFQESHPNTKKGFLISLDPEFYPVSQNIYNLPIGLLLGKE